VPFRLAIVGAGRIATKSHMPAALAVPGVQLAAIVDPVAERAREMAQAFGVAPRIATSVAEVVGEIDGAVIATPNHTHCALALECFRAGVSTLIEKPLAISVAEGETIARSAREHRATVAVGYVTRFFEGVVLMRDLLQQGYFGSLRRFAYQFGTTGRWAPMSAYSLNRQAAGGGVVVVNGTHFLDRMLYWFGYPERIEYRDDSQGGPEANAFAVFRYTTSGGELEGRVRFSKTVPLRNGFTMETSEGAVTLAEGDQAPLVFRSKAQPLVESVLRPRRAGAAAPARRRHFEMQLADFVEACRTGRPPRVTADEGIASLRLIEALYAGRSPMSSDWYGEPQRQARRA
jgi:predicted dehydrogenase